MSREKGRGERMFPARPSPGPDFGQCVAVVAVAVVVVAVVVAAPAGAALAEVGLGEIMALQAEMVSVPPEPRPLGR